VRRAGPCSSSDLAFMVPTAPELPTRLCARQVQALVWFSRASSSDSTYNSVDMRRTSLWIAAGRNPAPPGDSGKPIELARCGLVRSKSLSIFRIMTFSDLWTACGQPWDKCKGPTCRRERCSTRSVIIRSHNATPKQNGLESDPDNLATGRAAEDYGSSSRSGGRRPAQPSGLSESDEVALYQPNERQADGTDWLP
jgi:hypothetical protein